MNTNLLYPYRVSLQEKDSDFEIAFDCLADDREHAIEQAEDAYPGCKILSCVRHDDGEARYVIFAKSEFDAADKAGFWSNQQG